MGFFFLLPFVSKMLSCQVEREEAFSTLLRSVHVKNVCVSETDSEIEAAYDQAIEISSWLANPQDSNM